MAKNLWLRPFDVTGEFVYRREMITPGGEKAAVGDTVINDHYLPRRLRQFYDQRSIAYADVWADFVNGTPEDKKELKVSTIVFPTVTPVVTNVNPEPEPVASIAFPAALPPVVEPATNERDELLKQAAELDIKVDGRWSDARLKTEIDKVLSA